MKPASSGGDSHGERASFLVIKATKPGLRRHLAAILTMRGTRQMRCPCRMAWRISCLRDVHLIGDTQGETAYHASISVAFIVETIKSLAESLRNRHGARTSPQPSPAGRGRLRWATGGPP